MQRDALERLSKAELIELVLRMQRPAKSTRHAAATIREQACADLQALGLQGRVDFPRQTQGTDDDMVGDCGSDGSSESSAGWSMSESLSQPDGRR